MAAPTIHARLEESGATGGGVRAVTVELEIVYAHENRLLIPTAADPTVSLMDCIWKRVDTSVTTRYIPARHRAGPGHPHSYPKPVLCIVGPALVLDRLFHHQEAQCHGRVDRVAGCGRSRFWRGLSSCWLQGWCIAQSAIVGVVKDTSGAVLPGVTVEAASDVLIEKVKSVITDGNGVYRIVDLRPGVYSVTFTLPGFSTFRRDELRLPAEFTATHQRRHAVGALEETITVTGAAPVVDVTTAVHTQVLNREAMDVIPTGRTIQGMAQLVVGINLSLPGHRRRARRCSRPTCPRTA